MTEKIKLRNISWWIKIPVFLFWGFILVLILASINGFFTGYLG